ncbi:MAG: hypothetical protein JO022_20930 [Acidobacteriaceae bacterium]|nr:hypothetical protein [Acidobacteriaceae bacterium]
MMLLIQLAPFALLIVGACACASFYFSLRKEIQDALKRISEQQRGITDFEERISAQLDEMRTMVREAEQRAGVLVAPTAPRSGLNLSKRSQVLRMSRMGQNSDHIATALSLPKREVDLLLKVQKIVLTSAAANTAS